MDCFGDHQSELGLVDETNEHYIWTRNMNTKKNRKEIGLLGSFEMYCWRKTEKVKWSDKVTNEEVLRRADKRLLLIPVSYTHLDVYKRQTYTI